MAQVAVSSAGPPSLWDLFCPPCPSTFLWHTLLWHNMVVCGMERYAVWHCGIVKHGASPPSPSILFLPVKQGSPGRFPEEKCLQKFDLVFNRCKKMILVKAHKAIACTGCHNCGSDWRNVVEQLKICREICPGLRRRLLEALNGCPLSVDSSPRCTSTCHS